MSILQSKLFPFLHFVKFVILTFECRITTLSWDFQQILFYEQATRPIVHRLLVYLLFISFFSDEVSVLLEMFPEACSLEIEQYLNDANGNTEAAVHLMLLKNGESCDDEGQESTLKIIDWSPKVKG